MANRSIFWFRRDLRLGDNPALLNAIAEGDEVVPVQLFFCFADKDFSDRLHFFGNRKNRKLRKSLGPDLVGGIFEYIADFDKVAGDRT